MEKCKKKNPHSSRFSPSTGIRPSKTGGGGGGGGGGG